MAYKSASKSIFDTLLYENDIKSPASSAIARPTQTIFLEPCILKPIGLLESLVRSALRCFRNPDNLSKEVLKEGKLSKKGEVFDIYFNFLHATEVSATGIPQFLVIRSKRTTEEQNGLIIVFPENHPDFFSGLYGGSSFPRDFYIPDVNLLYTFHRILKENGCLFSLDFEDSGLKMATIHGVLKFIYGVDIFSTEIKCSQMTITPNIATQTISYRDLLQIFLNVIVAQRGISFSQSIFGNQDMRDLCTNFWLGGDRAQASSGVSRQPKSFIEQVLFDAKQYDEPASTLFPEVPLAMRKKIFLHHEVLFPYLSKLSEYTFEVNALEFKGRNFEDFEFSKDQQPFTISRTTEEVEKFTSLNKLARVVFRRRELELGEHHLKIVSHLQDTFSEPKRKGIFKSSISLEAHHVANEVKDFFIPDLDSLFIFLTILKAKNIDCYLINYQGVTAQVIHAAVVMDTMFGKKDLIQVERLVSVINPATDIATKYNPKTNYGEHLLTILREVLRKCSVELSVNFKNKKTYALLSWLVNQGAVVEYKKTLEDRVINQFFSRSFCSFSIASVDFNRFLFDKIMVKNKDILELPTSGERTPVGGMQGLATRIRQALTPMSPPLPELSFYFLPAFLMLSLNQGSMLLYLHSFVECMAPYYIELKQSTLNFSHVLFINKVVVSQHEVELHLCIQSNAAQEAGLTLNSYFSYAFHIHEKTIRIKNTEIKFSPLLEKRVPFFYTPSPDHKVLENPNSDPAAWQRISNIAYLIQKGNLSVEMVKSMSEQESQHESIC